MLLERQTIKEIKKMIKQRIITYNLTDMDIKYNRNRIKKIKRIYDYDNIKKESEELSVKIKRFDIIKNPSEKLKKERMELIIKIQQIGEKIQKIEKMVEELKTLKNNRGSLMLFIKYCKKYLDERLWK